jgi:SEC-C motif
MTSQHEPCPCGSGRTYGKCCSDKAFQYEEASDGSTVRSIPISDELVPFLQDAVNDLGPDASPDSLVFSDFQFEHLEFEMTKAMEVAGIDPAIIYAFQETGMLISEENMEMFSQKDIDLWQSKIEEYNYRISGERTQFPIGTQAFFGPDDTLTSKIEVGVVLHENAEPIIQRYFGSNVLEDSKVQASISRFFEEHQVKKVIVTDGNVGCPHEEGEDFPEGGECPFCPFWQQNV